MAQFCEKEKIGQFKSIQYEHFNGEKEQYDGIETKLTVEITGMQRPGILNDGQLDGEVPEHYQASFTAGNNRVFGIKNLKVQVGTNTSPWRYVEDFQAGDMHKVLVTG